VRRRVQQDTLGRRGHKHDPLYKIRGLLRHGVEHLTEKQQAKIGHCLDAGDPTDEVNLTWQCYQQLRSIYHAAPAKGREIAIKVLDSFHTCPIPEVARLGRTLRAWRAQVLAYFDTSGVSNGGTEAINLITEKVRRLSVNRPSLGRIAVVCGLPGSAAERADTGRSRCSRRNADGVSGGGCRWRAQAGRAGQRCRAGEPVP
jgi:transposase